MASTLRRGFRKTRLWHIAVIVVVVSVASALLTPPDPFSQLLYLASGLAIAAVVYISVLAVTELLE